MAKAAKFVARDGTLLSFAGWTAQQKNHDYSYFKEFENGRIYAACRVVKFSVLRRRNCVCGQSSWHCDEV
jgi:hypothetical protein